MAGTPENRSEGQGFDAPPDERSQRVDVIGNAENIIIPSLRDLLRINAETTSGEDWERAEREKAARFARTAREGLALPIWGGLDVLKASRLRRANSGPTLVKKDIRGKEILYGRKNASLQGCVVITDGPILQESVRPSVKDSLLVGGLILYGSNNNNSPFNPDQLLLMAQLGEAIRDRDQERISEFLSQLDLQALSYDKSTYKPRGNDVDAYKARYGDLATIASIADKRYLDLLQGGETTDVQVDNSVLLGLSARVLGGTIRNSVIAASHGVLANAHIDVENCYFVTGTYNIDVEYVEKGRRGNPQRALDAVAAVKDLPQSPLLSM